MFNKIIKFLLVFYLSIYGAILIVNSVGFSFQKGIGYKYFLVALIWLVLVVLAAHLLTNTVHILVFSSVIFLAHLAFIKMVNLEQISDYALLLDASIQIKDGVSQYLNYPYFKFWPYQLGFCTYQAIVLKIIPDVFILKFFNIIYTFIISFSVYGIAEMLVNKRVARISLLMHLTLLPLLMMMPVLTNQFLSVACFYLAIYCELKYHKSAWKGPLIFSVLVSIGQVIRPIGITIILSYIVFQLLSMFDNLQKNTIISKVKRIGIVISVYVLVTGTVSGMLIISGISPDGLSNNDPLWKFVTGTNIETAGSYSLEDSNIVHNASLTKEERYSREISLIKQRVNHPQKIIALVITKIKTAWSDFQPTWFTFTKNSDNAVTIAGSNIIVDKAVYRYRMIERAVFFIIIIVAWPTLVFWTTNNSLSENGTMIILTIALYTFIHLFVEIQARYMFFTFGFVCIFFAIGLEFILKYTHKILANFLDLKQLKGQ